MTIWDKITAAAGPADASTLGALLARLGDAFSGAKRADQEAAGIGSPPHHRVAFTIAVIALGAKMAKADGIVNRVEVDAFKKVFQAPPGEADKVGRVFDLARQDVAGYQSYADQLGRLFKEDRRLLQDVLEGLLHIAIADGTMMASEDAYLADVASRFGFKPSEYRCLRSRFVADDRSPYDVLRIAPETSNEELKAQYRRLVAANHPDKLMARGIPKEFVELANRKLAAINEAYEVLARERGLK